MLPRHARGLLAVGLTLMLASTACSDPEFEAEWALRRQAIHVFVGQESWTHSIAFSPDGKQVAAGFVHAGFVWDVTTGALGRPLAPIPWRLGMVPVHKERFRCGGREIGPDIVAFSPDSKIVAVGGGHHYKGGQTISLVDADTGKEIRRVGMPGAATTHFAFSPDGKKINVAGLNYLESWEVASGERLSRTEIPRGFLQAGFSPDGKTVALYGDISNDAPARITEMVVLRDLATGKELLRFGKPGVKITRYLRPVFSPDSKTLAVFHTDGAAYLYDVATGKPIRTFLEDVPAGREDQRGGHPFVAFSPCGKYLATGDVRSEKGAALVWETATGKLLRRFQFRFTPFMTAAFSPDSKTLAVATSACVFLFDWENAGLDGRGGRR